MCRCGSMELYWVTEWGYIQHLAAAQIERAMNQNPTTSRLGRLLELGWDHACDAMFVADCRTGRLVDVNPAAERLTGYSRQELMGMDRTLLHPEDERGAVQDAFRKSIADGRTVDGFHVQRKDGGRVPVSISSSEGFDADGLLLAVGVIRDASELERREHLVAVKLERDQAQKELAEALSAVVAAITTGFEMRDPYTAGHQRRVAEIACAIGRKMGWDEDGLQALHVASLVHDVGKISIPAEILAKPTRLTPTEWALIREHPETGHAILKDVPFRWPIAEAVLQHHERLDGSGYPRGLRGDEILPGARILAVADMVEAMACSRPYRPGLGLKVALKEIESQAGTGLDADVVRTCASLFREKGSSLAGWDQR